MLRSAKELSGYVLAGVDGDIGRCEDFLFEEDAWIVRHMVADTGKWLPGRKVLISPISLGDPDWAAKRLHVHLDREQIENAPPLATDMPVSREYELDLHKHFQIPVYWGGPGAWAGVGTPHLLRAARFEDVEPKSAGSGTLRSVEEVRRYGVEATDGSLGGVHDAIIDDSTWHIRYLVVDTRKWLPGRKVLISPDWVSDIEWATKTARVEVSRDIVRNSPEYSPDEPVNRRYEERLYDFYGRPVYW